MTPKEAFEILKEFSERKYDNEDYWDKKRLDAETLLRKALNELESLKKPPTVDEVCMELSRHYKEQVSYSNERHNHMFYFEKYKMGIVRLRDDSNIGFIQGDYHKTNNLPPYLVTLIGRFYKSLEEK